MKNKLYLLILVFLVMIIPSYANDNLDKSQIEAEDILNQFLSNEYHGEVDQRMNYSAIHIADKLLYGDNLSELTLPGIIICISCDPLVPVIDYKIINAVVKNPKHIVFQVIFDQVGETNSDLLYFRKLVFNQVSKTEIEYDLVLTDQGWKILDPVIPRVSVKALKTEFEENWKSCDKNLSDPIKKEHASESFKNHCAHYKFELDKINDYFKRFSVN